MSSSLPPRHLPAVFHVDLADFLFPFDVVAVDVVDASAAQPTAGAVLAAAASAVERFMKDADALLARGVFYQNTHILNPFPIFYVVFPAGVKGRANTMTATQLAPLCVCLLQS